MTLKRVNKWLRVVQRQSSTNLPVLRSTFRVLVATSDFGVGGWTTGSSFSESLPPELSMETSVSIPTWSHPNTDRDRVAKAFAFDGAFGGVGCVRDFLGSGKSDSSSGESSKSSLSLLSVKLTLNLQNWKKSAVSLSMINVGWIESFFWCRESQFAVILKLFLPYHFFLPSFSLVLWIVWV